MNQSVNNQTKKTRKLSLHDLAKSCNGLLFKSTVSAELPKTFKELAETEPGVILSILPNLKRWNKQLNQLKCD